MVGVDDEQWLDTCLMRRRWGRRSETYLFGSRKGEAERFGPLTDGTPYDLVFVFDDVGYNFEPSEIMAAYGLVQLEKLAEFNRRRQHNFQMLDDAMEAHVDRVIRPRTTDDVTTTWMRYPFLLDETIDRTDVQKRLGERKIATRMVWTGNILRQPGFADIEHRAPHDGFPNADRITNTSLSLPSHNSLTSDDVGYLVESLHAVFGAL
jgi:CDP-6-deoxy-D-xylo-4-hexulose-3-dehydrase